MNTTKKSYAAIIAVSVIFGLSFIFTRSTEGRASTFTLLSWRFTLSFVIMTILVLVGVMKLTLRGKPILPLLLLGLLQPVILYICETTGTFLTSASESGLMVATSPIVTMLIASAVFKKKPSAFQFGAVVLSVIGVALVVLGRSSSAPTLNILGYLSLCGSVLTGAFFQIFNQKLDGYSVFDKTYVMMAEGAAVFTLCACVEHASKGTIKAWLTLPFRDAGFLTALLFLSVACSVIAFTLQNYSLSNIGASRTASFGGLTTVVSVAAGVIILGEPFTLIQVIGAALVITGIYGANVSIKKRARQ